MQEHKTIMLDLKSYRKLSIARDVAGRRRGRGLSFNAFILELVSRKIDFLDIDDQLKRFLMGLSGRLSTLGYVKGIMLFGSVAKGSCNGNSDIDLLVVTKDGSGYPGIAKVIDGTRADAMALSDRDLPHLVCPVVMGADNMGGIKPIYFDLADYGIVLYERESVLTDFVDRVSGIRHKRSNVDGVEVLTWQ